MYVPEMRRAIHITCCLERSGTLSPKQLRSLGTGPKTVSILSSNFYGWFARLAFGQYALAAGTAAYGQVGERCPGSGGGIRTSSRSARHPRRSHG